MPRCRDWITPGGRAGGLGHQTRGVDSAVAQAYLVGGLMGGGGEWGQGTGLLIKNQVPRFTDHILGRTPEKLIFNKRLGQF